jgi:hypothetical protein
MFLVLVELWGALEDIKSDMCFFTTLHQTTFPKFHWCNLLLLCDERFCSTGFRARALKSCEMVGGFPSFVGSHAMEGSRYLHACQCAPPNCCYWDALPHQTLLEDALPCASLLRFVQTLQKLLVPCLKSKITKQITLWVTRVVITLWVVFSLHNIFFVTLCQIARASVPTDFEEGQAARISRINRYFALSQQGQTLLPF